MRNQAHDKHPADEILPEQRLLPASSGAPQEARTPLPRRGSPRTAGRRYQARQEAEEAHTPFQEERAARSRPLLCRYERLRNQRLASSGSRAPERNVHAPPLEVLLPMASGGLDVCVIFPEDEMIWSPTSGTFPHGYYINVRLLERANLYCCITTFHLLVIFCSFF